MSLSPAPERLPLTTPDLAAERLARLRELLPGAVVEGKVVPERLAELVGAAQVSSQPERYGLGYAGRAEALREMLAPSNGTLRPDRAGSENWDTTENLIIEGDNLHVLKLLQSAYAGAVKLIYIDPPYNTGNDFVYPDDFRQGVAHYKELTQQTLTTNPETGGRYHSDWLKMLHPRLALARNLLRDDGAIFISIDDHEVHNLRLLMDEVFGEENFVACLVWEKGRKNDAKLFSVGHEYLILYARSVLHLRERKTVWREEKPGAREIWEHYLKLRARHGSRDDAVNDDLKRWYSSLPAKHPSKKWARYWRVDRNGPWRDRDISWPGGGGPRYDVIHPKTGKPCEVPEAGWRYAKPEDMAAMISARLVEFREDHTQPPFRKAHIKPVAEELAEDAPENGEDEEEFATQVRGTYFYKQSQVAVRALRELLGPKVFNNPKDHEELARLADYVLAGTQDDLVLDFFAGSGTTAHAVLELNKQDGGNRKFILVQYPEPTGRDDFKTIADITRERVRRVIRKLTTEDTENTEKKRQAEFELGDSSVPSVSSVVQSAPGFRAYRLDDSNFKLWDGATAPRDGAALAQQLEFIAHNVHAGRSDDDLLAEILLKCGHPGVTLGSPVEVRDVAGQPVHFLANGSLAICLGRALTQAILRGLIAAGPKRVLCLDVGFGGNDELKTNTVLEMESHGIRFQTV